MPKARRPKGQVVSLRPMATIGRPRPQARAIVLEHIANGATAKEAAERAGCSERSASRWTAEPAFRAELAEIQKARREEAEQFLASEIRKSLTTMRELRDDPDVESSVRLRASVELLDRVGVVKTDRSEVHLHQHAEDVSDEEIDQELARIQAKREKGEPDADDPH